ncbi:heat shock protein HslJ [Solirubrobacter pauli]|uniref:Heat shock protein HslJ n=1 Tax=Solirubrobacter pauli TaxID=166793 RepID=A0A660LHH5_9ACTN|nr:META domain-containing protein [Solirubrobacter pauli]RKQ93410.1 heat shock protein HslJ [Solirubrobacter pauli]
MRPLFACALLLLLLTACGNDDRAASGATLEGTPWVLVSGVDVPGWEAATPSATFKAGTLSGSSGCNRYSTSYAAEGDTLRLGTVAGTRMACGSPAAEVEAAFTAALARVARWRTDGEQLVLADADDAEQLRFAPASPLGAWTVTSFLQRDAVTGPLEGTELTATFEADGTLSGHAGCNRYSAKWSGDLEITGIFHTEMACAKPLMEQEQRYLAALAKAAGFSVEGSTLTLLTATGTIAVTYARAP